MLVFSFFFSQILWFWSKSRIYSEAFLATLKCVPTASLSAFYCFSIFGSADVRHKAEIVDIKDPSLKLLLQATVCFMSRGFLFFFVSPFPPEYSF